MDTVKTLRDIVDAIEGLPIYRYYTKDELSEADKCDMLRADLELQRIHDQLVLILDKNTTA